MANKAERYLVYMGFETSKPTPSKATSRGYKREFIHTTTIIMVMSFLSDSPLSLVSTVCICIGIGPPAGTWTTY